MLERGKFSCSAAIATALAVSNGNQINPDCEATKLSLHLTNERYACNSDHLYAVPRVDLHEIEWIEADSIETDVPKFIAGSSTVTTTGRNNPRRCCRTSTSSGYSSHSPPLSAGSYSCYAPAFPSQSFFGGLAMKDQLCGGLAVIHETETIPRPIWPTVFPSARELYHNEEHPEYDSVYACCGCGCTYTYSYCDWDHGKSTYTSAHEVLLELSRTLNSVIEGKNVMTPEEILQNISFKVAQGIGLKGGLYEYVYQNSAFLPSKITHLNDSSCCRIHCNKNSSSRINPVNSKLYNNTRQFYLHNPAWYTTLCNCEHTSKLGSISKCNEQSGIGDELETKKSSPIVLLMNDHYQKTISEEALQNDRTINANGEAKHNRNKVVPNDAEYAMQLECSDGDSLNQDIVFSPRKNKCDYHKRGFARDLDFTLDVSRAELLSRAIAKAKRKRQWCRVLIAFFGLVFFVLSVVIVSLTVTRGRKVFGSM